MPRRPPTASSPHIALITASAGPIGGMETFTRALVGWLRDDGWRVTLGINGCDSLSRRDDGVGVQSLDWVNSADLSGDRRYKLSVMWSRYCWFRQIRPDVVLFVQSSNAPFRAAVLAARLARVPVVMTQRTMPGSIPDVPSRRHFLGLLPGLGLHRRLLIWRARLAAIFSNRIVYNNHAVRTLYQKDYRYPVDKGVVIPNAVPLQSCEKTAASRETLTIGYLGRLGREKRVDVLLQAFARIGDLPAKLDIYGEGPERVALEQLTQQLNLTDRVRFHGPAPDVNEAYSKFDVVVLCSPRESSSNMVLEAMAAGRATIVTSVGGLPELVGDSGVCVEPLNVTQLAEAMRELILNEQRRLQLGQTARQRVAWRHAPHDVSQQWTTLLRTVAAGSASRIQIAAESDSGRIDALPAEMST